MKTNFYIAGIFALRILMSNIVLADSDRGNFIEAKEILEKVTL